jgi:hypothetical protein
LPLHPDWEPAPVCSWRVDWDLPPIRGESPADNARRRYELWHERARVRRQQWRAAARSLFTPLAPTLRHLEITPHLSGQQQQQKARELTLPPALSLLQALSSLVVRTDEGRLASVGPGLRRLTGLVRLEVESPKWGGGFLASTPSAATTSNRSCGWRSSAFRTRPAAPASTSLGRRRACGR